MRHRKSGRKLNRNSAHRKALFKNLAIALIEQEIIKTTLPKAKELRKFIEPLITRAKEDSVANRRHAFNKLRSDSAVAKLFSEVAVNSKDRNGGYTRIIKAGFRALKPALIILVYPPFRSFEFTATSLKSFATALSDLNLLKACLLLATESSFALVIRGSMNFLSSFAFGSVVLIISCSIKAIARFLNKAFLWAEFLLSFLPDFLCLIFYPTGGQFSTFIPRDNSFDAKTSLISFNDFFPKFGVLSKSNSDL